VKATRTTLNPYNLPHAFTRHQSRQESLKLIRHLAVVFKISQSNQTLIKTRRPCSIPMSTTPSLQLDQIKPMHLIAVLSKVGSQSAQTGPTGRSNKGRETKATGSWITTRSCTRNHLAPRSAQCSQDHRSWEVLVAMKSSWTPRSRVRRSSSPPKRCGLPQVNPLCLIKPINSLWMRPRETGTDSNCWRRTRQDRKSKARLSRGQPPWDTKLLRTEVNALKLPVEACLW